MKLTILGSGTTVPTKQRYPSCYLVEHDNTRILLDCGPLSMARLIENGIDLHSIDAVVITHFHPDHFSGLLPFVHARFVDDLYKEREHRELTVIGPHSLKARWEKLRSVFWMERETYPLTLKERSAPAHDRVKIFTFFTFPVRHVSWFHSIGIRIMGGDKVISYTGDLGFEQDEKFHQSLLNSDILLIEAASARPSRTHLTAKDAVVFGRQAMAKKIVLTHLHDACLAMAQAEAQEDPEHITVAQDGMVFDLS